MRVLIVEDDRATSRLLAGLIASWGHETVVAENGQQALQSFADSSPQLVLLDWMLPDVDGLEVCRTIRTLGGAVAAHIIMLTSRADRGDLVAGLDAGADEYLVKPVDPIELRARLSAGERMIDLQRRLADRVGELETALASVHRLSGLLPICAYCHSIRDDTNYWHRVEEYLSEHSDVTFSHGICPTCRPRAQQEMSAEPAVPVVKAMTELLIVDDEEVMRALLSRWAGAAGYVVAEAASVSEALARIATTTPAVVLVDLNLSGGDDGRLLADQLRQLCPGTAVILMSGSAPPPASSSLPGGAVAYLNKPFKRAQLLAALTLADDWRLEHRAAAVFAR